MKTLLRIVVYLLVLASAVCIVLGDYGRAAAFAGLMVAFAFVAGH